jgi:hypothetical protein
MTMRTEGFNFIWNWIHFSVSTARDTNGNLHEIVVSSDKAGSQIDLMTRESAAMCSLLLQHGVPLDVICAELTQDERGLPDSAIGIALAHVAKQESADRG